jgi:hypothetical protein
MGKTLGQLGSPLGRTTASCWFAVSPRSASFTTSSTAWHCGSTSAAMDRGQRHESRLLWLGEDCVVIDQPDMTPAIGLAGLARQSPATGAAISAWEPDPNGNGGAN